MTGLERDFLHQLTRIANALEKQNTFQEKALDSMNQPMQQEETIISSVESEEFDESNDFSQDQKDLKDLLKKLTTLR